MLINKGSNNKVSKNFTENEYYAKSFGTNGSPFDLSDKTIAGGQIIRDYFNVPMTVNSSYRTKAWDLKKGRSGKSQHNLLKAVDYSFPGNENILLMYHQEILNKGDLYNRLKQAGINGFGLYDNFLHIDARSTPAFWDQRITTKKKTPTITEIVEAYNDFEDGSQDFQQAKQNSFLTFFVLLIFAFIIYLYVINRNK